MRIAGAAVVSCVLCGVAPGQDAGEIMERVREHYGSVERVKITAVQHVTVDGVEESTEVVMYAARPNRFSMRMEEAGGFAFVSDGERLIQYYGMLGDSGVYAESEAPEDFSGLMSEAMLGDPVETASVVTTSHMLALDLMSRGMVLSAQEAEYIGKEIVKEEHAGEDLVKETEEFVGEGQTKPPAKRQPEDQKAREDQEPAGEPVKEQEAHRIRLSGAQADVELWVATGDQPWVLRAKPDLTKMFEELEGMDVGFEAPDMQIVHRFSWEPDAELAGEFEFTPPEGAEKVDSIVEAIMAQAGRTERTSDLVGAPAPSAELDTLAGETMSLSSHRGEDIVVLDFWATWCPPCVEGLPKVAAVMEKFEDEDVVLYAVNVQEGESTIREFLREHELDVPVALDRDGSVSTAYGATAIPQTVIIGKDGTVQAVHVGLLPDLEQRLTEEIRALLEDKDLFEPKEPKKGGETGGG